MIDRKQRWYAIYTRPKAEKKVYEELLLRNIESYLPLQRSLKQWYDRKKWIETPLIRSYVFVKINNREYFKTIKIDGIVRFVTFEGQPAPIPETQIKSLRILLASDEELEVSDEKFEPGDPVEVRSGPFARLKGELVEYRGSKKVLVRIDHIGQSVLVTIPEIRLKLLSGINF
jgi:transcription antitermination factor NusG